MYFTRLIFEFSLTNPITKYYIFELLKIISSNRFSHNEMAFIKIYYLKFLDVLTITDNIINDV